MKFVLFICLVFWWCMTLFGMIRSQIKYARNDLGEDDPVVDDPVVIEATDLLGPRGTRILYTIAFFISILIDNILLIIALALSKYANNPDVFHHYLATLLMLNIVFDLAASPAILKLIKDHKASTKSRIANGLMDLITIIFGTITIFIGFN